MGAGSVASLRLALLSPHRFSSVRIPRWAHTDIGPRAFAPPWIGAWYRPEIDRCLQAGAHQGIQRPDASGGWLRVVAPWSFLVRPRAGHRTGPGAQINPTCILHASCIRRGLWRVLRRIESEARVTRSKTLCRPPRATSTIAYTWCRCCGTMA